MKKNLGKTGRFFSIDYFKKPSISKNLTISLAIIVIAVASTILAILYINQSDNMRQQLELKGDEYASSIADVLAFPIWNLDINNIEQIGTIFAQNELINEIRIKDSSGNTFYEFSKSKKPLLKINRFKSIVYKGKSIGYVEIALTKEKLEHDLAFLLVSTILTLAVAIVVIVSTTGFLLKVFLRRPLASLQQGMEQLAEGVFYSFEAIPQKELVGIYTIFSQMALKVKTREDALKDSENKYRTLVDNINIGIFQTTASGRYLQVNPAMATIFGYDSPEDMIDASVIDCFPDLNDRQKFWNGLNAKGVVRGLRIAMEKKDHTPIRASITASAQYDELGNIQRFEGVLEDITEQNKLEMQLQQAQKMESLGALAGGVAHDFNNILTAIIGYGNLLQMKMRQDETLKDYITQILVSSERAANLTKSLLAFSRKQEIVTVPVNINELIINFEKMIKRLIGEDIELRISTTQEDLVVMADRSQMEQMLMNLVINARDVMPNGGMLSITLEQMEMNVKFQNEHPVLQTGKHVVIIVSDTGFGMDEITRNRIFEPFFTTKESGKGTGLGLSIVFGIIKQHNGEITVYSEPGKGSTFRVYLPLIKPSVKEKEILTLALPRGGNETILLAEDDSMVRKLGKQVLEEFGYTVIEAEDGEKAIKKYMENKDAVRLVIIDVIMPKKNGKEVYDELRVITPDIKTLFTSGYTAEILHRHGILEEGLNFLSKPVQPNVFAAKVREILDKC